ncbi:5-methyltetrahydropteroyltriglutamate--homocysteine S-methyltransferase [Silicimonas algicola]|uniref:5-methyltetrahydropteroyltriglutamate--homocysteine methyltransferase n=1 Tax=Silicimonas algicola TaxID=1826607 RepID=A0A316GRE1_9RHOB|nr:5-methyltetrahydropteroyltriglutamate--homocysteine S-methyltransferase [Silicimonas algicola]AZQ67990.1 5-methyltetrahydropteroyltriglutamate--homocysteine S-methyltransferase [Silicimonas algicola]PWK57567.1 5-methyltetrahydropteroyltriglutamate--homocysteine methyltransferase [Silicimonas algicola]
MPTPPFRADHVGSLLRPAAITDARRRHASAEITAWDLKAIEDEAIPELIRMQEEVGLKAVTDGEARRSFWHYDFMGMLDGLDLEERDPEGGVQFAGVKLRPIFPTISGKLDFPADHPMLDHFRFVKDHTTVVPKISIPGPSCCHFRTAPEDIKVAAYLDDPQSLFDDLAATYRKAVHAFYDAGCRYLQMDDIFFAYLCDPKHRAAKAEAGQDPDWLIERYSWMMREAIKDRPEDMVIGMHMCRGNFRSTHAAEGAYDAAAEAIFSTGVDVFFMEYDTDRAGGLEPLGLLPKGKQRVLPGFITTKTGELEDMDWLKARFEEASKYCDIDQLGIAPQCGFASTEEGNAITPDDQRRKLDLVVRCAEEIWGGV